jgi:hypothetical protein
MDLITGEVKEWRFRKLEQKHCTYLLTAGHAAFCCLKINISGKLSVLNITKF